MAEVKKITDEQVKAKYDRGYNYLYSSNYKTKINEIFTKFFPRYKRADVSSSGFSRGNINNANTIRSQKTFNKIGINKHTNNNISNVGAQLATIRRENYINEIYGPEFELGFKFKNTTRIKMKKAGFTTDEIKSAERKFLSVIEEEILAIISNSNYRQTRDTVIGQLDVIGATCEVIERSLSGKYSFNPVSMLDVTCYPIGNGAEDVIFIDRVSTYLDFATWLQSTYNVPYEVENKKDDDVVNFAIYQIPEYMVDGDNSRWVYHYGILDTEKGKILYQASPEIFKHIILSVINRDEDNYLGWGLGDEKGNDIHRLLRMQNYHDINVARDALPVIYKNAKLIKNSTNKVLAPGAEVGFNLPNGEKIGDNMYVLPNGNSQAISNTIEIHKNELMKGERFPTPQEMPANTPATYAYIYRQELIINRSNRTVVIKKELVDKEMINILKMMKSMEGTTTFLDIIDDKTKDDLKQINFDIEREEFEVVVMGELERAKRKQDYQNTQAVLQSGGEIAANVVIPHKYMLMLKHTFNPMDIFKPDEEIEQETNKMLDERSEIATAQGLLQQELLANAGKKEG